MGLKYSGSSAFVDALVDQTGAVGISGSYPDETALFTPGRPHSPLNYFRSFPGQLDLPGLLALITEGRLGLDSSRHHSNVSRFILEGREADRTVNFQNFPQLSEEKFMRIAGEEEVLGPLSILSFQPYFRLVSRIVKFSFPDNQLVILNNDPPAHHFWVDNSTGGSRIFVVRRASRDIIVDRKTLDNLKGARRLLEVVVKTAKLQNLNQSITKWDVKLIQFEDLVLNPSYRVKLFQGIGFDYQMRREGLFRPKDSAQNIGVHRGRMSLLDHLAWLTGIALGLFFSPQRRGSAFRVSHSKA